MSKYFIFIVVTVCLNAVSQLLMKTGMSQVGQIEMSSKSALELALRAAVNPLILAGLTTMTLSMGTHLMSLSRFEVSFAFPFLSLAYVIVAAYGYLFLGEQLSPTRIAGIATIMFGTFLISRS
jgi:drug/metabolite transporter (DMT)-like permease